MWGIMTIRTRVRALGLAAAASSLVLAACAPTAGGGSDSDATDTADVSTDITDVEDYTLTVWDQEVRGGQNAQMEQLNAAFEDKYPNVTIDRVSQSFDDLQTTLRLALTGDDAPDVVQANDGRNMMGQFVAADQLICLDSWSEAYA